MKEILFGAQITCPKQNYCILLFHEMKEEPQILFHTAIPVQVWTGPEGSRRLRLPYQDNLHLKVVRMSDLCTSCLYTPRKYISLV
jgi:hypothetical protein